MGVARHRHRHHLRVAVGALLVAALLLSAAVPGARAQEETEDEDEFSYVPGAPKGPAGWGKIKKEWAKCSTGRMQSPIDLADARAEPVPSLGHLDYHYRHAEAAIENRGHDIKLGFKGDAGRLVINGTVYHLKQLHWHTPSEHTINGHRYDMEVHLVHQTPANKTAVVGVLYKASSHVPDPFLKKLEPFIRRVKGTRNKEEPVGKVDPNGATSPGSVYYRYMGSLTTPPCTEGVVWTVCEKDRPVLQSQIQLLRDAVDDGNEMNARPLQPVNNREIDVFRRKHHKHY